MKVNLKKVKPLEFQTSSLVAQVIDEGRGCLRYIDIKNRFHGIYFYHEDARALRDWLNKVLP